MPSGGAAGLNIDGSRIGTPILPDAMDVETGGLAARRLRTDLVDLGELGRQSRPVADRQRHGVLLPRRVCRLD